MDENLKEIEKKIQNGESLTTEELKAIWDFKLNSDNK